MFDFSNITKSTAVLEIIILMLVAAIIAFLIAWLYWRQRYKKQEGEYAAYRQAAEEKEAQLTGDLQAMTVERDNTREELKLTQEKLQALQLIQIKYDTLETKHSELEKDFAKLTDQYNAVLSRNAGLDARVRSLEKESQDQLTQIEGLNEENQGLKAEIKKLNKEVAKRDKELAKQKEEIEALNGDLAQLQTDYGIVEAKLANCLNRDGDNEEESNPANEGETNDSAAETTANGAELTLNLYGGEGQEKKKGTPSKKSKEEVLEELKAKRDTINYELIGSGSEADKDDLKVIKGIGPWIEQKLNALGIYHFNQIARFDENLIEQVTKAIETFPGRIQRDDWIGQARALSSPPRKNEVGT